MACTSPLSRAMTRGAALFLAILFAISFADAAPRDELAARGLEYTASAFVNRAGAGDLEAVKLFQAAGMDVNSTSGIGSETYTPLVAAAANGHTDVVRFLFEHGGDLEGADTRNTAVMAAALGGHTDIVKYAIAQGGKVNGHHRQGGTALTMAVLKGNPEIVQLLLDKGADVNAAGAHNQTPLIYAAVFGYVEIVRILLEHGADTTVKEDMFGATALGRSSNPKVIAMLKAAGAQ